MKTSVVRRLWSVVGKRSVRKGTPEQAQRAPDQMHLPTKVRLFVKPFCGWCRQAMDWLDNNGIPYEVLDVTADERAYEEMYQLSGQTLAPVIEVDGQVLADFGPRELAAFWTKLEKAHEPR